ncbi:tRNA 2-thiouridine(34) synthase MnmA [Candidatus Nomurabacteria bacterium]|nr:tRNA 2-thiouridine(34) synthase MnmA [Candidatus Nomurabacteria bacterium]
MAKKVVFVGLSGGVDSAVSATLLKRQGYDVVGVFIKTWHPDFLECNEEDERRDAMRVAAHLDIPFLTFDFEDIYKKEVADYMISEYKLGRTPNPDVMCNKHVKFGAFLKKAISMGADYVATGHYAEVLNIKHLKNFLSGRFHSQSGGKPEKFLNVLLKGMDSSKDQSYFLWTLDQKQLSKILFPVGGLEKTEVRKLAKKWSLPVAKKKDSQGICFLGAIDLKEFLKHYIKEKKGKVLNTNHEVIGHHNGAFFHTLGERHGFTITKKSPNDGPYYIVEKDIKKNILVVSQNKSVSESAMGIEYKIQNVNWISETPKKNRTYTAQIRYHGELLPCTIKTENKNKVTVIFKKSVLVAPGQSVVIYDKDVCLGGGVVI